MINEKVRKIEDVELLKRILKSKKYPPYSPYLADGLEEVAGKYNCYAHIWGLDKGEIEQFPENEVFDIPGFSGLEFEFPSSEEDLVQKVFQDMDLLDVDIRISTVDEPLQADEWKIAIYYSDHDYHFMRQDRDGTWSHKVGYTPFIFSEKAPTKYLVLHPDPDIPPYKLVTICTLRVKNDPEQVKERTRDFDDDGNDRKPISQSQSIKKQKDEKQKVKYDDLDAGMDR